MRSYDEIDADARDRPAFSNGTEGHGWMAANCDRCTHDKSARDDSVKPDPANKGLLGCPIIAVTMLSKTPVEFLDGPRGETGLYGIADQYHCIEFRDEDDGPSPEPQPIPDPPGQELLLPREPYEAPRMFVQPTPAEMPA